MRSVKCQRSNCDGELLDPKSAVKHIGLALKDKPILPCWLQFQKSETEKRLVCAKCEMYYAPEDIKRERI